MKTSSQSVKLDSSKTAKYLSADVRKAVLGEAISVNYSDGKVAWVGKFCISPTRTITWVLRLSTVNVDTTSRYN